jgi:hypothetical protein
VRNATTSTKAYESYSKGRQLLETYEVGNMKQASELFTQAKSIDYHSPLGYEGIIALNTFLGFYNKQMQKPFSTYYQQAEAEGLDQSLRMRGANGDIQDAVCVLL